MSDVDDAIEAALEPASAADKSEVPDLHDDPRRTASG
jgi:hypothetical protein